MLHELPRFPHRSRAVRFSLGLRRGRGMLDFKHTDRTRREFESLSLDHLDALFSAGLRLTKNERDAEDLVQDTFLRAFRFFAKFARGTNMKAWLFKILTNTFINKYRRR